VTFLSVQIEVIYIYIYTYIYIYREREREREGENRMHAFGDPLAFLLNRLRKITTQAPDSAQTAADRQKC